MTVTRLIPLALAACAAFAQKAPARLEFDVASIKPSAPLTESVHIGVRIDGSQVYFTGYALKDYIRIAYGVKDYLVTGPDWFASERFDIAAKLPPGGATRDQINEMLQTLLVDRFKLTTHREKKEFSVYALVVAKGGSKMNETPVQADGPTVTVAASGDRNGVSVALPGGGSFTFADSKMEAKKITMVRFAEMMARFVDRPVVDMTNLPNAYDLKLELTPKDYRAMQIRAAITAGVQLPPEAARLTLNEAPDSLLTAMQLVGLKLETRKAPLEVIVVDHLEHSPTDN
jgi:uncharacterized protein (TIGR03435 family)